MEDMILIGFGGHAKSVIDTIEKQKQYRIIGFTDPDKQLTYRNYHVVGVDDDLNDLFLSGIRNAFVTIGYLGKSDIREKLYQKLKKIGYHIPNIIDDTAAIASDARIGEGTFVGKNAVINSNTSVGNMCIINTGAILEHDCIVGDFSHIAVGAVACGNVCVGQRTLVGANATILQGLKVGKDVRIGAGSIVLNDIPDEVTAYGTWKGLHNRLEDLR